MNMKEMRNVEPVELLPIPSKIKDIDSDLVELEKSILELMDRLSGVVTPVSIPVEQGGVSGGSVCEAKKHPFVLEELTHYSSRIMISTGAIKGLMDRLLI